MVLWPSHKAFSKIIKYVETMVSSQQICDLLIETEPNWWLLKQFLANINGLDRKNWGPIHPLSQGDSK